MAEIINLKTPQQVLDSALQKVQLEMYQEALSELENKQPNDPEMIGNSAWVAAQASFQIGQFEKGYDYLIKALQMKAATRRDAVTEPLFEPARAQTRFVTIVTSTDVDAMSGNGREAEETKTPPDTSIAKPPAATAKPSTSVVSAGDASVSVDANGRTEVKAGGASAKLP
jgi:hypothetical protein